MREKLIELFETAADPLEVAVCGEVLVSTSKMADHLIANGVTIPVRCEECVHYKPQKQSFKWAGTVKYCVRSAAVKMPPDGFCSCGERREGE